MQKPMPPWFASIYLVKGGQSVHFASCDTLQLEAWQKLVKMYGAFDEVLDEQLKENVQGIMCKSHITKCTACCLHLLSSVSVKEELRQMIQKEIQQLRLHQIKESHAMPPALWQKVQLALVMRFKRDE
eukprot:5796253-Amphidinium_carterae.7